MSESFSSALRLGGLEDYLTPAQECVLPFLQQQPDEQASKQDAGAADASDTAGDVVPRLRPTRASGRRLGQQNKESEQNNQGRQSERSKERKDIKQSEDCKTESQEATTAVPQGAAATPSASVSRRAAKASVETATASESALATAAAASAAAAPPVVGVSKVGKISLSDCLSCSGCLTSAEGILLNQQSAEEFFAIIARKQRRGASTSKQAKTVITPQTPQQANANMNAQAEQQGVQQRGPRVVGVSLSSQGIVAVARHFGCSPGVAAGRISFLFRLLGADLVFSMAAAEALALLESQKEFIGRLYEHQKCINVLEGGHTKTKLEVAPLILDEPLPPPAATPEATEARTLVASLLPCSGPLPLVTSYCPGLVLYAEKNLEPPLLDFLSRVRSAQQIQGLLVKSAVRISVEASSFLLAVKAHAWPWNQATRALQYPRTQARLETAAPWELLRMILRRSPYSCFVFETAAGGAGADAGGAAMGSVRVLGNTKAGAGEPSTDAVETNTATPHNSASEAANLPAAAAATAADNHMCGLLPDEFLHVCVMPCFDKKLEAARPHFSHSQHQPDEAPFTLAASRLAFGSFKEPWVEVDMVLATSELPQLLHAANVSFDQLPCAPLDCLVPGTALRLVACSLRRAAANNRATGPATPQTTDDMLLDGSGGIVNGSAETDSAGSVDGSVGIASALAAEEAAAQAEKAAKLLPPSPFSPMDQAVCSRHAPCKGATGIARPTAVLAGSGGYLEFLFLQTARGVFGREVCLQGLEFFRGPNEELQSLALLPLLSSERAASANTSTPSRSRERHRGLWSDRQPALLRGAFAYGFRNIQNVAQQLRLLLPPDSQGTQKGSGINGGSGGVGGYSLALREIGASIPHIVELGACPGGCLNGGGQAIKVETVKKQADAGFISNACTAGAGCCLASGVPESSADACEPKIIGKNREPLTSLTRLLHAELELIAPQTHPLALPAYVFLFGCCYGEEGGPAAGAALEQLEVLLRQTAELKALQSLLCSDRSDSLPLRVWLAPRVTEVFRTVFKPVKSAEKSGAVISVADLKW